MLAIDLLLFHSMTSTVSAISSLRHTIETQSIGVSKTSDKYIQVKQRVNYKSPASHSKSSTQQGLRYTQNFPKGWINSISQTNSLETMTKIRTLHHRHISLLIQILPRNIYQVSVQYYEHEVLLGLVLPNAN